MRNYAKQSAAACRHAAKALPLSTGICIVGIRAADRSRKSEIAFPGHCCYYIIYIINRANIIYIIYQYLYPNRRVRIALARPVVMISFSVLAQKTEVTRKLRKPDEFMFSILLFFSLNFFDLLRPQLVLALPMAIGR